jgi:hypothetical protein
MAQLFDLTLYRTPDDVMDESGEDMKGISGGEVKDFLLNSDIFPDLHALTIRKRGDDDRMFQVYKNVITRSGSIISRWQITMRTEPNMAGNTLLHKANVLKRYDVYDRFKNTFPGAVGGRRRRATRKRVLRKRSTRRSNRRS